MRTQQSPGEKGIPVAAAQTSIPAGCIDYPKTHKAGYFRPVEAVRGGTHTFKEEAVDARPGQIEGIMAFIEAYWLRNPQQRLGQAILNLTRDENGGVANTNTLWNLSADQIIERMHSNARAN